MINSEVEKDLWNQLASSTLPPAIGTILSGIRVGKQYVHMYTKDSRPVSHKLQHYLIHKFEKMKEYYLQHFFK